MLKMYIDLIRKGSIVWNDWRKSNPSVIPDLTGIDLEGNILNNFNFQEVKLSRAKMNSTNLFGSCLCGAILKKADLRKADLGKTDLSGADLTDTRMQYTNLIHSDLSDSNLSGSNLSWANLRSTNLRGTNLSQTRLLQTDLTRSTITGANLYGSSRDGWKIHDIECVYVYFDEARMKRIPQNRNFSEREFEELYASLPEITYYFSDDFTPLTPLIMDTVVNEINQKNNTFELKLDSFHSRGQPHAVFTVKHKLQHGKVLEEIDTRYKEKALKLEGQVEILKDLLSGAIERPQLIQQASQIINQPERIGHTFNTASSRDTSIATDQGTVSKINK